MKRRKFLVGLGSIAAGGAAVMGSGAFAVDAEDRDHQGTIVADTNAYLNLEPNSPYSSLGNDGELNVSLDRLNNDSVTQLDDVFYIENTGTEPVDVGIDEVTTAPDVSIESVPVTSDPPAGGSQEGNELLNNVGGATLNVGERIGVGVEIDVPDAGAGTSSGGSFHVDADSA